MTCTLEVELVQASLLVRTFKWTLQLNLLESFCDNIYQGTLSDNLNLQNGIKGQTNVDFLLGCRKINLQPFQLR